MLDAFDENGTYHPFEVRIQVVDEVGGVGQIDDRPMKDGLRRILRLNFLLVTYSMSQRDPLSLWTEVLCDHQAQGSGEFTGTIDE